MLRRFRDPVCISIIDCSKTRFLCVGKFLFYCSNRLILTTDILLAFMILNLLFEFLKCMYYDKCCWLYFLLTNDVSKYVIFVAIADGGLVSVLKISP
jgi:hypothetical protein